MSKYCDICGVAISEKSHYSCCNKCLEQQRYNECTKMTINEYEKKYPNNPIIVNVGELIFNYPSINNMLTKRHSCGLKIPEYVYGTELRCAKINIIKAINEALEEAGDGAEFYSDQLENLIDFVSEWNIENGLEYFVKAKIVINIPEKLRKSMVVNYPRP